MSHKAIIVTDLGFGDAGKGTIIDALARRGNVSAVVRYNGGGQAAHNVVSPEGVHTTYAQFGSGTFVKGVRTHLSRFMLIDPITLRNEAEHLEHLGCGNVFARLSVDEEALVVSPFHKATNRICERLRGKGAHGSCGMGIGETMAHALEYPSDALYMRDLRHEDRLMAKLARIQEVKRLEVLAVDPRAYPDIAQEFELLLDSEMPRRIARAYRSIAMRFLITDSNYLSRLAEQGDLLFEGAQGVMLDEWYGFHPYTTWSTTTSENALTLLSDIAFAGNVERIGILRAYHTRHGAGPFVTEDEMLTNLLPESHNGTGKWQGGFRVGWFDMVAAHYALTVNGGVDSLAITNLDRFTQVKDRKMCLAYVSETGKRISRLPMKSERANLVVQEELTKLVAGCSPVYEPAPENNEQYLEALEEALNVPISITSHGPSALDKCFKTRNAN
jgi:adenylosuccinate synthase